MDLNLEFTSALLVLETQHRGTSPSRGTSSVITGGASFGSSLSLELYFSLDMYKYLVIFTEDRGIFLVYCWELG